MTKNARIVLGVVILVVIIAAAYAFWGTGPKTARGITIGFIGPLTGDAANIGQNAKAAVMLAADEVNAAGGVQGKPLDVIYEDGQCTGAAASNAAQKLMSVDGVPVILGGACSGETSAFAPAARQAGVVVFSYCSSAPALSHAGIFRDYPSDAYQGSFGADYIYNKLGKRKAAVMYVKTDWGDGIRQVFESEFQKLGGKIVDEEGFDQNTTDLRTQLAKVKAANPDIVYFLSYTSEAIVGIKQASEIGLRAKFFGADGWDDPKIFSTAGKLADGDMYTVPAAAHLDEFKAKMKAATGSDSVQVCSPTAYDGLKILAQVMNKVGADPAAIRAELFRTQYAGGVSSDKISFDANGDLVGANYEVKESEGGAAAPVQ